MSIPYGTRYLILSCFNKNDKQFKGIKETAEKLAKAKSVYFTYWNNKKLLLNRRRVLKYVIVTGHGDSNNAGFSYKNIILKPDDIKLNTNTKLILLGCFQGEKRIKEEWINKTGAKSVLGATGESESALTTLFFLNLLNSSLSNIENWTNKWIKANDYLRPHFINFRKIYKLKNTNFIKLVQTVTNLKPIEAFLKVGEKYYNYLMNLW